jgi:hypothetical protein
VIAGTYVRLGIGGMVRNRGKKTDLGVQVGYDLESPVQGHNLSLDVFLQDSGYPPGLNTLNNSTVVKRRKQTR